MSRKNPGAKAAPRNVKTKPADIARAHRKAEALEYRLQGLSIREIAKRMKVGRSTVHEWIVDEIDSITREPAEHVHKMELDRLDSLMVALWKKAKDGDVDAIDRVLVIMRDRRKMLGVDGPMKVELTGPGGKPLGNSSADDLLEKLAGLVAGEASSGEATPDSSEPQ